MFSKWGFRKRGSVSRRIVQNSRPGEAFHLVWLAKFRRVANPPSR